MSARVFSSVQIPIRDLDGFTDRLTELSADGWVVDTISFVSGDAVAVLSMPIGGGATPAEATGALVPSDSVPPAVDADADDSGPSAAAPGIQPKPEAGDGGSWLDALSAHDDPQPQEVVAPLDVDDGPVHVTAEDALPADWYPDPGERFEQRYWDGENWTEHVADGDGLQHVDPPIG